MAPTFNHPQLVARSAGVLPAQRQHCHAGGGTRGHRWLALAVQPHHPVQGTPPYLQHANQAGKGSAKADLLASIQRETQVFSSLARGLNIKANS